MKILSSQLSSEIKIPQILLFNKIKAKSIGYNVLKPVNVTETKVLLQKMVKACLLDDGVGLAAPQINVFKEVFIIREMDGDNKPLESFIAYFNPEWRAVAEEGKEEGIEGCLSVPGLPFTVSRWKTIDATWWELQEDGSFVERKERFTGFKARIYQHEFFHLKAKSIIDDGKPYGNDKPIAEDKKQQKALNLGVNLKAKAVKVGGGASGARPKYS